MAVTTAKANHFSARIVPAIWVVAAAAAMVLLPWPVGMIGIGLIVGGVCGEMLTLVENASERSGQNRPTPWAIQWLLIAIFPISMIMIGILSGRAALAWLVGVVFLSDVGAFYGGRVLSKYTGGHKLAERISPGKTWEGVVVGLLGATLWCTLMLPFGFGINIGLLYCLAWSLAIVGMAGDLLESWLKRQAGVKDSGTLLRDHGGLLDRLDGLLAAAPVAAALLLVLLQN